MLFYKLVRVIEGNLKPFRYLSPHRCFSRTTVSNQDNVHASIEFFQLVPKAREGFTGTVFVPDFYAGRPQSQYGEAHGDPVIIIRFYLSTMGLTSVDGEFAIIRGALEDGLGHIETALRVLEPVLDWDRHVHRVLCLLTSERTFIQNQLRLLDLAQQNTDDALANRPPWPLGWYILP